MAKEKLITRTIRITTVEAVFMDTETAEVRKVDLDIPNIAEMKYPGDYIQENYALYSEKYVFHRTLKTTDKLYGITVQHFLENAELLNEKEVTENA